MQEIVGAWRRGACVVEENTAASGLDETQQEAGDGALAGAGFADEAESFAAHDIE